VVVFVLLFFFFQAEDGIRDDLVTGVQTCALPILSRAGPAAVRLADSSDPESDVTRNPSDPRVEREQALRSLLVAYTLRETKATRSEERRVGKECRRRRWTK